MDCPEAMRLLREWEDAKKQLKQANRNSPKELEQAKKYAREAREAFREHWKLHRCD
jgi:F0F1-type ATP synthase membrane subunit b/b'